jgi:hypothetical protein
MDFCYLAQAPEITEDGCCKIELALKEFHDHKDAITLAGAWQGKKNITKNWDIPKLEFLQSVVPNICDNGVTIQWSADTMEHAHITEIKNPSDSSNNQQYESQICCYLAWANKCHQFDLATAVRKGHIDFCDWKSDKSNHHDDDNDSDVEDPKQPIEAIMSTASLLSNITPVSPLAGITQSNADYFQLAAALQHGSYPRAPQPFQTFLAGKIAICLAHEPSFNQMSVEQTAEMFDLLDLHSALDDYLAQAGTNQRTAGGQWMANHDSLLPINLKALEVWTKVWLQNCGYFLPHNVLPAQTVNASPPSTSNGWQAGRSDAVLVNTDPNMIWPHSGYEGIYQRQCSVWSKSELICRPLHQIRLIFHAMCSNSSMTLPGTHCFLTYAQCFDVVPQISQAISGSSSQKGPYPDPATTMFVLNCAWRHDQTILGGIIPLSQVWNLVELTPRFGEKANTRLIKETTIEYSAEFLLDKYFNKELFYALD